MIVGLSLRAFGWGFPALRFIFLGPRAARSPWMLRRALLAALVGAAASFDATILEIKHSNGNNGMYFNVDGGGLTGTETVKQCRAGAEVWEGQIRVFGSQDSSQTDGDSHGRRESGATAGNWQAGDFLTAASSCPSSFDTTILGVEHSLTSNGRYFNFDKGNLAALSSAQVSSQEFTTTVKQCRAGAEVWSGGITWWSYPDSSQTVGDGHGRKSTGAAANDWQTGDFITTDTTSACPTPAPTPAPTYPTCTCSNGSPATNAACTSQVTHYLHTRIHTCPHHTLPTHTYTLALILALDT